MLGIEAVLGRVFLPEEDQPNRVFSVVISERLWWRCFNSDPHIIGKAIGLNDKALQSMEVPRLKGRPFDKRDVKRRRTSSSLMRHSRGATSPAKTPLVGA
jgi:hypothetical protein